MTRNVSRADLRRGAPVASGARPPQEWWDRGHIENASWELGDAEDPNDPQDPFAAGDFGRDPAQQNYPWKRLRQDDEDGEPDTGASSSSRGRDERKPWRASSASRSRKPQDPIPPTDKKGPTGIRSTNESARGAARLPRTWSCASRRGKRRWRQPRRKKIGCAPPGKKRTTYDTSATAPSAAGRATYVVRGHAI